MPNVPLCLDQTQYADCGNDGNALFHAVLLGDVNGARTATAGSKLRTEEKGTMVFDLTEAQSLGNGEYRFPVKYLADSPIHAFDFVMNYDPTAWEVVYVEASTEASLVEINPVWNKYQNTQLFLTTYSMKGISTRSAIYYITVKVKDGLDSKGLGTIASFLNGDKAAATVKTQTATGLGDYGTGEKF